MTTADLSPSMKKALLTAQRNEITEFHIYNRLADGCKDADNAEVLRRIAKDEQRHYEFWKQYTGEDVAPMWGKVRWFVTLAKTLGLTFSIKLMEKGEEQAQDVYGGIADVLPEASAIVSDEDDHEHELIEMIDEESLRYVGSMVLGLNDALVELTGALAGFTLAMQNTRLIGTAGLITGVAASLSMAASEYLSTKAEESEQDPVKASLYTGIAYVLTVVLLIAPYFIFSSYLAALSVTILNAVVVILVFTFYISVARDLSFKRRFTEMVGISLGVALLSFFIGYIVGEVFDIQL